MKQIVIIHAGAVGDLVLAMPALRAVRTAWPGARLTLIGRPERAVLARLAGLADAVADLETSGLWRLMGGTPAPAAPGHSPPSPGRRPTASLPAPLRGADLVVDFLSQGTLAAHRAAPRTVTVRSMPPPDWTESAAAWYLEQVCRALGLPAALAEPEVPVSRALIERAREDLASRGIGGRFAAIHPGSGSPRKNWPLERFAEVAAWLRTAPPHPTLSHKGRGGKRPALAIVWIVGPAEEERGPHPAPAPGDALLVAPPLDLLAGALASADLYLGNDSGITHLAAAVRGPDGRPTPTVAIFGPTDPRLWAPRGPHVRTVQGAGGKVDAVTVRDVWRAARQAAGSGGTASPPSPQDPGAPRPDAPDD